MLYPRVKFEDGKELCRVQWAKDRLDEWFQFYTAKQCPDWLWPWFLAILGKGTPDDMGALAEYAFETFTDDMITLAQLHEATNPWDFGGTGWVRGVLKQELMMKLEPQFTTWLHLHRSAEREL